MHKEISIKKWWRQEKEPIDLDKATQDTFIQAFLQMNQKILQENLKIKLI